MKSPTLSLAVVASAALALLSGCTPTPPSPTPSSASPTASPSPSASTASLIAIDKPAASATVHTPVELSGTANTFEGALTVEAVAANGSRLCVRDVMATSGTGTPGTWSAVLAFPPPDTATAVTLRAYSSSPKDGSIINLVERSVTVSAERPAIIITSPACGATVAAGSALAVSGSAFVFEAAFTLELRDSSGRPVVTQSVMAARGDKESPWSATLTIPPGLAANAYDLVAFDNSAKDGSVVDEFPVQVHVR